MWASNARPGPTNDGRVTVTYSIVEQRDDDRFLLPGKLMDVDVCSVGKMGKRSRV